MIYHDPEDMKNLALTGLDNDVRKTLMWAADEIATLLKQRDALLSVISRDGDAVSDPEKKVVEAVILRKTWVEAERRVGSLVRQLGIAIRALKFYADDGLESIYYRP